MKRFYFLIAFIYIFSLMNSSGQDINTGLLIYYPFEKASPLDYSGNQNHATAIGDLRRSSGIRGESIRIVGQGTFGESGGHLLLPDIAIEDMNEFTVGFWIRHIGNTHPEGCSYFMFGNLEAGWSGMRSHLPKDAEESDRALNFSVGSGAPQSVDFRKGDYGQWIFYCLVYKNGHMTVYRDDEIIADFDQSLSIGNGGGAIGRTMWTRDSLFSTRFVGDMDEFRIYSRALTPEDVRYLYKPCEFENIDYQRFDTEEALKLIGTAKLQEEGFIRITEDITYQRGAVWYENKVRVEKGFSTEFSFQISEGYNASAKDNSLPGADGLAFVIQNSQEDALGLWGSGLGYGGIANSLAIEFDMFNNSYEYEPEDDVYHDPNGNHIAVQSLGRDFNSQYHGDATIAITTDVIEILTDGTEYFVKIDYDIIPNTLRIYLNDQPRFDEPALVVPDLELGKLLRLDCNGEAYVGFTSATGKSYQNHDLMSWNFCPVFFVKPLPVIEGKRFVCDGEKVGLRVSGDYEAIEWSTGSVSDSITVDRPGIYSVRAQDSAGCWRSSDIFVFMHQLPDPALEIIGDHPFCDGGSVLLRTKNEFAFYEWSTGATTRSINVKSPGVYSVTVSDTNGCTAYSEKEIIVWDNPRPVIIPSFDAPYCTGDTVTLSTSDEYTEYLWSTGETTPTIRVHRPQLYSVTVVDSNGCTGTSRDIDMIFNRRPVPSISGPQSVCEANIAEYSIDMFTNSTIIWSAPMGNIISGQGDEAVRIEWPESGMAELIVEQISEMGCVGRDTLNVRIDSTLHPVIEYDKSYFCRGTSLVLSAGEDYAEYYWSNGENTPSIEIDRAGDYWVRVVGESGCEGVSDTVTINMYENPITKIQGNQLFCRGESITLSSDREHAEYYWSNGATTRSIEVSEEGEYWLQVFDERGCTSADTVTALYKNPEFSGLGEADFGIIYIDRSEELIFNLKNESALPAVIAGMKLDGDADGDITFSADPAESATVHPGGEMEITLTFTPREERNYADTLRIFVSQPCTDTLIIPCSAIGLRYTFEGIFTLTRQEAQVGDPAFAVPFYGRINRQDTVVNLAQIDVRIRFDAGIYQPDSISIGELTGNQIDQGDRVIDFTLRDVTLDGEDRLLTTVYGLVTLGEEQDVPLRIPEINWYSDNPYKVSEGAIKITGLCQPDILPIRLREINNMSIWPNPAEGEINVEIKTGGSAVLNIYNVHGRLVLTREFGLSEIGRAQRIDLSDLPAGVYRASASSGGEIISTGFILY